MILVVSFSDGTNGETLLINGFSQTDRLFPPIAKVIKLLTKVLPDQVRVGNTATFFELLPTKSKDKVGQSKAGEFMWLIKASSAMA